MVAVSENSALVIYRPRNCFSCENIGQNNFCGIKNWYVDNGFAGKAYADTCKFYLESLKKPEIIELC